MLVGQHKRTLEDFCNDGITFYQGRNFNPSDKDRFYKVDSQDGLKFVALSELKLTGDQEYDKVIDFVSRTGKKNICRNRVYSSS